MKKKVLISVAALGLLFAGLVGCNKNNPSAEPSKEPGSQEPSANPSANPSTPAGSSDPAGSSSKHVHTYDETKWESSETQHWHPATCEHTTQKGSVASHSFVEVAEESTPATCDVPGIKVEKCSVCGYKRETPVTAEHDFQDAASGHEKAEGEVTQTYQKCSRDNTYKIAWDAQDEAKVASSGFDSNGKFKAKGDYVQYTFYSPIPMRARLYAKIADRSSESQYDRDAKTGNQSIWYDYYNGPDWKYAVKVNDAEIDQSAQTDIDVKGTNIPLKEIVYTDFLESGESELVAPWFEFDVKTGQNTLRIERAQGYSVSVKDFRVIGLESEEPFEGYKVTFAAEHCKVFVYQTKAYDTETPVEATSAIARDETGAIVPYDIEDIELQPQVSFKVVCDEGYSVTVNNVTVTPVESYKNLKQNPDNQEGQDNIFRVTKIKGDITITIAPVQGEQAQGYKVKFNATNAQVKVYIGPKAETGDNLDEPDDGGFYYARLKDAPYDIGFTTPQLNFEVVCDNGYEFNPTITDDKVDFITFTPADGKVGYNKFKQNADGTFNMTKIDSDLTITITATSTSGGGAVTYSSVGSLSFNQDATVVIDNKLEQAEDPYITYTSTTGVAIKVIKNTSSNNVNVWKADYASARFYIGHKITFSHANDFQRVVLTCDSGYETFKAEAEGTTIAALKEANVTVTYDSEAKTITLDLPAPVKSFDLVPDKQIRPNNVELFALGA